jgi:hypothetical protein
MPQLGNRGTYVHYSGRLAIALALVGALGCGSAAVKSAEVVEPMPAVAEDLPEVVEEAEPETPEANVYVHLKTITDRSEGRVSKKRRATRANDMRDLIVEELRASPAVTLERSHAEDHGLRQYTVDATIEKLNRRVRGRFVEVVCELRLSISDGRGRMLSFMTGGVAVQVPRRTFRRKYEPQLQREALEGAARKINRDLMAYLDGAAH